MPQIDFYILSTNQLNACYRYLCRVVEKAHHQSHQIYVLANNVQEAQAIDEALWTFKETSFIPHTGPNETMAMSIPVHIDTIAPNAAHQDVLINLQSEAPDCHAQFKRILEFVPKIDNKPQLARARFSFYKAQGYAVNTHNISEVS